ncbi:SsrA-binding protein SmpB [Buchnera aphidicola str. APS (Acyrthosiphon pisum)]|uniref:SsrA-binding protein n=3 Tax=Buchnera aphidicola TaxID=9 RepID=SSRP_BUCAI|nr:SsrA-binding protein SmpB [Buchnera aphidicola]B8D7F1.1 RecName: Full=SsrA-binding protein; AltName: Full=Small protein B [Buchnera aphidicola str. Tuc7 (Acyrthosiphon pisum)]B8D947.1 RecName: Full=SsrA-binding protein; AltName: Full=Small protein B [Buchnera aphidicola str. 5A (Acyrthosiphon pisum)]P57342.1 RecName: Full=SsrA-binding protein; AltName: Full=Small protein B [Buchnera aphidicola str. APS (Acyrthosiphon pisum)]pir/D84959/ small protein B [imported] - Buchnera sp. (strain APS) [
MLQKKKYQKKSSKIIINKKAYYNYFIEKVFQSGLVLEGWEIKSIRSGKVNISESYIINDRNEMYLCNCLIEPLQMSSNRFSCDPTRKKKLLLHKNEIDFLSLKKKNTGYTMVSLSLFWKKSWCKLEFGLAKGKTAQDKRINLKKREWEQEKLKILKKTKETY